MESVRDTDEFERMKLVAEIERDRGLVAQYDENQSYYRAKIENNRYKVGRLDERLGGTT